MSLFKDLVTIWKSEDKLSQAWSESNKMLVTSHNMFTESVECLRTGEKNTVIKKLKQRDLEINNYQRDVRKKVITHFSVVRDITNLNSGLVLINMVVDIERVGDYTKNILDLAKNHPNKVLSEGLSKDLRIIERAVIKRFGNTVKVIEEMDEKRAIKLLKTYRRDLGKISDRIVNKCLSGNINLGDESKTVVLALYARYLKRIGAHLKNITSVVVNPFETIGYKK